MINAFLFDISFHCGYFFKTCSILFGKYPLTLRSFDGHLFFRNVEFNRCVSLDHLMLRSELMVLEEQLCEAKKDTDRIAVLEHFLLNRKRQETPDQLIMAAISLIYQYKGNIRIRELATQLHTSHSPLKKRFRQVVGASPKKFASIVRFHHLISQHEKQDSLTGVAYEAGFYDQPHFIKEFKRFTGGIPKEFFSRK